MITLPGWVPDPCISDWRQGMENGWRDECVDWQPRTETDVDFKRILVIKFQAWLSGDMNRAVFQWYRWTDSPWRWGISVIWVTVSAKGRTSFFSPFPQFMKYRVNFLKWSCVFLTKWDKFFLLKTINGKRTMQFFYKASENLRRA